VSARFARLRIAGFKSFAEAASIEILPGLTGIVGPNGCGKSNVVEALRWAMGESSARSLRGDEMDDLIFAGSAARPARNVAEVTLTLEDAAGLAPPPIPDQPELQISRQIERGAGSSYRVNGREIRARDVQTLFADLASGARSSAMVSQGQVSAIINARPSERRSILEEAAGLTGMHARRHEAELKLRATEANLARAEDLRQQLEGRLAELGSQSRQAGRYREVAAGLRAAEAGLLVLLHGRARLAVRQGLEAAVSTEGASHAAERHAREAAAAELRAEAAVGEPREAEGVARTALERLRIAGETLAGEAARAEADAADAASRCEQSRADAGEAAARLDDACTALARIETDHAATGLLRAALPARRTQAEQALHEAEARLAEATAASSLATAQEASARDRTARITREHEAAGLRQSRLDGQLAVLRAEREAALRDLPDENALARLRSACDAAIRSLEAARITAEQADEARMEAARDADACLAAANEARRAQDAARLADDEAARRTARIATELGAIEASCDEAARARVPDAARGAARDDAMRCQDAVAAARQALEAAENRRAVAQQAHAEVRQRLAEAEQRRLQIGAARKAAETALERANAQHDQLARDAAQAEAALIADDALRAADDGLAAAEQALATARHGLADADAAHLSAEQAAAEEARALAAAVAEQARIEAEADGLARAIGSQADPASSASWLSLADALSVPPGLEPALAAVLAEGLEATLDEAAPRHWRSLPSLEDRGPEDRVLPPGATTLARLIDAPDALGRLLSHAVLIDDPAEGDRLQGGLAPGQCLVTREGALWRWDGYRLAAGRSGGNAAARGALALEQRNRLRQTHAQREQAITRSAALRDRMEVLAETRARRAADAADARSRRDRAERRLTELRESVSGLTAQAGAARARLDAIIPQHASARQTRDEAALALAEAEAQDAAQPDPQGPGLDAARAEEATSLQAQAAAWRQRQAAEHRLEAARSAEAALLARHAEAESRLAVLLPQRDRLAQEQLGALADAANARAALAALAPADQAQQALGRTLAAAADAETHEAAARQARQQAELRRDHAQAERAEATSRLERQRSRIDALTPRLDAVGEERQEAIATLDGLLAEAAEAPDPRLAAQASGAARDALVQARAHEAGCREARAQHVAEATALEAAHQSLDAARIDWSRREAIARQGHGAALVRLAADTAARDALAAMPLRSGQLRAEHALALAEAERAHGLSIALLEDRVQALLRAQSDRQQADIAWSEAREARLRAQGRAEQAEAILARLLADTPDPPEGVPDDLSEAAEAGLRRRIARLTREREEIGPVNLRADIEGREAQARADGIARELEELEAALSRLRGSIGHLNREGRERLLAVFETVDRHFRSLFSRMFNGGRAHLGMVGNDDPLLAGLEIYAQPPGKKLATLSLLSGGEQALTALSLIFAVFRCSPAPVCVLDEVDAPLDDANVDRFCALLADMVAESGTRFLIVTHHQLTMAHMDRLYGVTMQERGVSRLLSVDLATASEMPDTERQRRTS